MNRFYARICALLLCVLMAASLFAGCTDNGAAASASPAASAAPSDSAPVPSASAAPEEAALGYPICAPGEVELEYWFPMFSEVMAVFTDYNDQDVIKEAEKRTGIHITWITPSSQNATEIFNVMISSGDYSDMINSSAYTGGGDGAINNGVYVKLNDLIDQFAPNYKKLLDSTEIYYKDTRTDLGSIWAFYTLCTLDRKQSGGLAWREDIAAKIGWKSIPQNVTEFDKFLQDAKAAGHTGFFNPPQYGFLNGYGGGILPPSFGASTGFLNVDGKVQYGPLMPGFKDYVAQMKKWYDEKILDPDFMSVAFFMSWPDIATGKYIVGIGVNGILGSIYAKTGVSDDPNCYIAAITPLDLADGTPVKSGNYASFVVSPTAISTDCENLEDAVRWLDYWYSEEGALLRNYGIEGYTFEYGTDGKPEYSDLVKNNPDVPVSTAMMAYCFTGGPGYSFTIYETDDVKKGDEVWADFNPVWNMPTGISMTSEEASSYATIMTDVNTFCEETVANMIIGNISLDDYQTAFVDKLKSLKIDEAVAMQQAALDRYNAR